MAASFDEFTDLLGDLLAKFDEGTRIPSSASVSRVGGKLLSKISHFPVSRFSASMLEGSFVAC